MRPHAPLELLDEPHLHMIHETSCRLLERKGVQFVPDEAIAAARAAGLQADPETHVVRFPRAVVEDALHSTPSRFLRRGASFDHDCDIGGGGLFLGAGSLPLYLIDAATRLRRPGTYRDMLDFIRLGNACRHLAIGNAVMKPHDVPDSVVHAVWNQAAVTFIAKPSCCWYADTVQAARDTIRILEAAAGGEQELREKKTWALTACPVGALKWGHSAIGLVEMTPKGIPVELMDTPFPGSLSPVTLAGTVALSNANLLAGLTLAQLINPGAPLLYCVYGGVMDMREARHAFGAPETALYTAAAVGLCRMYGIPSNMTVPAVSSKVPDAQSAYEKMITALLPALAGADCLSLFGGILDFGLSASFEQMLIDDEMAGQILRLRKPFEVTAETLAEDLIFAVDHGGHFLDSEHTMRHYREELCLPTRADRSDYEEWRRRGGLDMQQRAAREAERCLATPLEKVIPDENAARVDRIVEEILDRERVRRTWGG
jgi:trimethylamine---corrinoid protein Co-methyltransferase